MTLGFNVSEWGVLNRSPDVICPECGSEEWHVVYYHSLVTDIDGERLLEWKSAKCDIHYIETFGMIIRLKFIGTLTGFYTPELVSEPIFNQPAFVRGEGIIVYSYPEYIRLGLNP